MIRKKENNKNIDLKTSIQHLAGVGPKKATVLQNVGVTNLQELLYYFPRRYLDRSTITPIAKLKVDDNATIVGKIISQNYVKTRKRGYYQVLVGDDSGHLKCVWFHGVSYMNKAFKNGDMVAMSGKVEFFNGYQFIHPDYDSLEKDEYSTLNTARIIPLYPSTADLKKKGLDSRGFRRLFGKIIGENEILATEILPVEILKKFSLPNINEAIIQIHFPDSMEKLKEAQKRFKFEELFFLQMMLCVKGKSIKLNKKRFIYDSAGELIKKIYEKLPFELTDAQKRVVHEIWDDMKSDRVMNRLLQGDVGSGKTIVAFLCSSIAIAHGFQTALMAPTEILAEQHYRNLKKISEPVGIKVSLLIGGQKAKVRQEILKEIESGKAELVVGTHALIQESVVFNKLSLVIIDEQHRFGVIQRNEVIKKGLHPDVLVMTATPIPRTMSMTLYGDMDVSVLDQVPARRGKIITKVVDKIKLPAVYDYTKKQLKEGGQAYIVYPLIQESEKMDLQAAIQAYEKLSSTVFKDFNLALLHGAMKSEEKDKIMHDFRSGTIDILVSTTVIEVGVDNPNASIMIIENSERFGLTQLHQLRGRIGRGERDSVCVLVERKKTNTSIRRLNVIKSTINGFDISEEDLKLRGPGEFYSTRQHGFPKMKIADLIADRELMIEAREEAQNILKLDPHLRRDKNKIIRSILLENYSEYMEFVNVL